MVPGEPKIITENGQYSCFVADKLTVVLFRRRMCVIFYTRDGFFSAREVLNVMNWVLDRIRLAKLTRGAILTEWLVAEARYTCCSGVCYF